MSMFTRTKAPAEPPADGFPLPEGFDDETSPTYVPEHLRDAWHRHAGTADTITHLHGTVQAIAEHRAWKAARPELFDETTGAIEWQTDPASGNSVGTRRKRPGQPPHLLDTAAELGARDGHLLYAETQDGEREARRILASEWATLATEAEHAMRLHHVILSHEYERREIALEHKRDKRNRCPVCGLSSVETGAPATRDVVPTGANGWGLRITLTSCAGCYLAAVSYWTTRLAVEPASLDGTRSRLDVVRDHFESRDL